METVREEVARDAVEVVEIAKASLDHGKQMLAIARQKAMRVASIKGCKLLRLQPPCLRLVVIRVRDEMDLDTFLVAAHWHTHEQRIRGMGELFDRRAGAVQQGSITAGTHSERT